MAASAKLSSFAAVNRNITNMLTTTSIGIYLGWNYASSGPVYQYSHSLLQNLHEKNVVPKIWQAPDPAALKKNLDAKCVLSLERKEENYESWILSQLSHQSIWHLGLVLGSLRLFAPLLERSLPTQTYAIGLLGSAVATAYVLPKTAQLSERSSTKAMGGNGVVTSLMVCSLLLPQARKAAGRFSLGMRVGLWTVLAAGVSLGAPDTVAEEEKVFWLHDFLPAGILSGIGTALGVRVFLR